MKACKEGHEEIAACLITAKAGLDIQDEDGSTALLLACDLDDKEQIAL